jgi:ABC-type uncharacterized transport system substrate-binding protein
MPATPQLKSGDARPLTRSPRRPAGNVTGFTSVETGLAGKWLELLKELSPALAAVTVVYNTENPAWRPRVELMRGVAPALGLRIVDAPVSSTAEIESGIGRLAKRTWGSWSCQACSRRRIATR